MQYTDRVVDVTNLSLEPIRRQKVAILGYGNQGRTHALNLRDSGVSVCVGARSGRGANQATEDGFHPLSVEAAVADSNVVMFLFGDTVIPDQHAAVLSHLEGSGKLVGFAHGYAYHFKKLTPASGCTYFLAAPKGPGALLRENFKRGGGLPGAFTLSPGAPQTDREIVLSYCKAIGVASSVLIETTFQEETEGDLFGEQAVLTGGMIALLEGAFDVLVKNGHQKETAFLDVCFEASVLIQLWIKFGPQGFAERISPTAFYGGLTRGKRIIDANARQKLEEMFQEVRNGTFAKEWGEEVAKGAPLLAEERARVRQTLLQETYRQMAPSILGND